jgi:hypothetical protein
MARTANPRRSARRQTKAHAGSTSAGTHSRVAASAARSSRSPSHASSPDIAGRRRRWSSRIVSGSARRAHRATDARSDPRYCYEQPDGRCSTLESGSASHFAHPVMRSQPAHISRDPRVDDSRRAPPAATKRGPHRGPPSRAHLTNLIPYQLSPADTVRRICVDACVDESPASERRPLPRWARS